jgi:DNA-binding HxlR family transcriptional regulator
MSSATSYGQFFPLAMAAEFLCSRWTILIFRELLLGSSSFNDISTGFARMSRTLLSAHLKELTVRGIVNKQMTTNSPHPEYQLTKAGQALSSVVFGMADWSQ